MRRRPACARPERVFWSAGSAARLAGLRAVVGRRAAAPLPRDRRRRAARAAARHRPQPGPVPARAGRAADAPPLTIRDARRPIRALARRRATASSRRTALFDAIGLLSYTEVPGIYVRVDTGFVFVFDHVTARIKERARGRLVLAVANPTRVRRDGSHPVGDGGRRRRAAAPGRGARRADRGRAGGGDDSGERAAAVRRPSPRPSPALRRERAPRRPLLLFGPGVRGRPSADAAAANPAPAAVVDGGGGCRRRERRWAPSRWRGASRPRTLGGLAVGIARPLALVLASVAIGRARAAARAHPAHALRAFRRRRARRPGSRAVGVCLRDEETPLARALVIDAAARARTLTPGGAVAPRRPKGLPALAIGRDRARRRGGRAGAVARGPRAGGARRRAPGAPLAAGALDVERDEARRGRGRRGGAPRRAAGGAGGGAGRARCAGSPRASSATATRWRSWRRCSARRPRRRSRRRATRRRWRRRRRRWRPRRRRAARARR